MEKINFKEIADKIGKISLVGLISAQALFPMRTEAQIAVINEKEGDIATIGIIETPYGFCLQGADHAQSILSESKKNDIKFLDEGFEEISKLDQLKNPKKAKNTFIKQSDIAFRCANTKANLFLRKKIIPSLLSEKDFKENLRKNPNSAIFRMESLMTPFLIGTNNKGKTIRVEPSDNKIPKELKKLKYSTEGTLGDRTQKIDICILNLRLKDIYKLPGNRQNKSDLVYQNNFIGLSKYNNPYANKTKKQFRVEPVVSGTSGSPLITNEKIVGSISSSLPSRKVQDLAFQQISKSVKLRRTMQNCIKLGFNSKNSQFTTIGTAFSDSIISNKTNFPITKINNQNTEIKSHYPTLYPVIQIKSKP